jgi:hypothetical protein
LNTEVTRQLSTRSRAACRSSLWECSNR